MISRFLTSELITKTNDNILKAEMSHLANSYHSSYKPTPGTIKKHNILKNLKNKNDLIIVRPDNGEWGSSSR